MGTVGTDGRDDLTGDLPRSPSGRVPQWVLDEAERREREQLAPLRITHEQWAQAETRVTDDGPAPRRTTRSTGDRVLSVVVVVLVVAVGVLAFVRTLWGHPDGFAGAWRDMLSGQSLTLEREPPEEPGVQPDGTLVLEDGSEYRLSRTPAGSGEGDEAGDAALGQPLTWSSCHPISYVVDTTGAPDDFVDRIDAAAAEVEAATGLTLVSEGVVTEPAGPRDAWQPERYGQRWAPVLIRWSDEATVPELEGTIAGLATTTYAPDPATGVTFRVSAVVDLDVTLLEWPAVRGDPSYVSTLRHELGHVVGLDHVDDPTELMHPSSGYARTFATGDLAGLDELGRGPCAQG